ncbi:hypothetical protein ACFOY4_04895 [Actinomadura syzygii]|uniref:hypothetical protein n=1 Tax=Actinomadura syzygii TaxID=1427538 RepID=UPI0016521E87|nr:hypothetical protein [Actinomadura syzygii]
MEMRGYNPAGTRSCVQAIEILLRALGVADEELPATFEEQVGCVRRSWPAAPGGANAC